MMGEQYLTLIASLPPHMPKLFKTRQTPISRLKLDERLQMLEPEHRQELALIENLVHWNRMAIDTSDLEMIKRGRAVEQQLQNAFIKEIVQWRLEERTIVAALRRRRLGINVPPPVTHWGYGRWLRYIEAHWMEPAFALEHIFPWIPEAAQLLQDNNYLALERLLLSLVWDHYGRVVGDHYFDFEAVVVYVLRWDVIDRWSRYNKQRAEQRFNDMLDSALGGYASLFA